MGIPVPTSPQIIAIGGPSCSGKTSVAAALVSALGENAAALLPLDAYYRDLRHLSARERAATNFDEPGSLDWPLLREHIGTLLRGGAVHAPGYDFVRHLRAKRTTLIEAKPVIVLEGLFALYARQVRDCCALLVFVDAPDGRMLERRLDRDVRERGRTPESVISQYTHHVAPMAQRHVLPTRDRAHMIVDGAASPEDSARCIAARLIAARATAEKRR